MCWQMKEKKMSVILKERKKRKSVEKKSIDKWKKKMSV